VVATAGVIMIVLGSLPKAAAIVAGIPHPVLGGAALAMFAAVAVVGIQTLAKVDFNDHRNAVIVGTSLGLAMLCTAQPFVSGAVPPWLSILFGSGITLGAVQPRRPVFPQQLTPTLRVWVAAAGPPAESCRNAAGRWHPRIGRCARRR
jgi:hypothetical protein